jgi:serine/threonine protein kinase
MLYLLFSIAQVGEMLRIQGLAHKNIKPSNILLTQLSQIKLAPCGTFPYDIDAVKAKVNLLEFTYLPPEASIPI